jgi:predicted HD superfamily hydrolase involved in NAD metabolism
MRSSLNMACTVEPDLPGRLRARLALELSPRRARHAESTARMARELARAWSIDPRAAEAVGLAHDLAREWSVQRLIGFLEGSGLDIMPEENEQPLLLHAPAASLLLDRVFGCREPDLLEAVRFHTLGRIGLCRLGRLLMIADYTEPLRDFRVDGFTGEIPDFGLDQALCRVLAHKIASGHRLAEATRAMYCSVCGERP